MSSASNCLYSYLPHPTLGNYIYTVLYFFSRMESAANKIGTYNIFYGLNACVPPTLMLKL